MDIKEPEIDLKAANLALTAQLAGEAVDPAKQGAAIVFLAAQVRDVAAQRDALAGALSRVAESLIELRRTPQPFAMHPGDPGWMTLTAVRDALASVGRGLPSEVHAALVEFALATR